MAGPWAAVARFWMAWPPASGDAHQDDEMRDDCLDLSTVLSDIAPVTLLADAADVAEAALRTPPGVGVLASPPLGRALRAAAPRWLVDRAGRPVCALGHGDAARAMAEAAGLAALDAPPALDFGGIDGDGDGTILAASRILEGGGAGPAATVRLLCDLLGAETVLPVPVAGPLARAVRFVAPTTVLVADQAARAALDGVQDAKGRRLSLIELPQPRRRQGSYADCLVVGSLVMLPAFNEPTDTEAQARLQAAVGGRRVVLHPVGGLAEGSLGAVVAVQPA